VFHVSQLRVAQGWDRRVLVLPKHLTELECQVMPKRLLGVRQQLRGRNDVLIVLIKWVDLPESKVT
jgi:hypothetical protein